MGGIDWSLSGKVGLPLGAERHWGWEMFLMFFLFFKHGSVSIIMLRTIWAVVVGGCSSFWRTARCENVCRSSTRCRPSLGSSQVQGTDYRPLWSLRWYLSLSPPSYTANLHLSCVHLLRSRRRNRNRRAVRFSRSAHRRRSIKMWRRRRIRSLPRRRRARARRRTQRHRIRNRRRWTQSRRLHRLLPM